MRDSWWWLVLPIGFVVAWYAIMYAIEPECPMDSTAKLTRGGWYCVVPARPR